MLKFDKKGMLNYFLSAVFFLAVAYRIVFIEAAYEEMRALHLSTWIAWPLIIFELCLAIGFLSKKFFKAASIAAIVFLGSAIAIALYWNFASILSSMGELFIFNPNPTDILLHLVFVLLCIKILSEK